MANFLDRTKPRRFSKPSGFRISFRQECFKSFFIRAPFPAFATHPAWLRQAQPSGVVQTGRSIRGAVENKVRSSIAPGYFHLIILISTILTSCSGHRHESETGSMPSAFTGEFKAIPGEKLHYRAHMGFLRLGDLDLAVAPEKVLFSQTPCWRITADGASSSGYAWISVVEHRWESLIDTASGTSLFTRRAARENRYRVEEEIRYLPDSQAISVKNIRKGTQKKYASSPAGMQDLINLMWKLRYSDFDSRQPGDTLNYLGFHDGEWLRFRMFYAGKKLLGKGKKAREVYELYPVGLATTFLRGENPAKVWIETAPGRRPLKARLETYFGNFTVDLVENYRASP